MSLREARESPITTLFETWSEAGGDFSREEWDGISLGSSVPSLGSVSHPKSVTGGGMMKKGQATSKEEASDDCSSRCSFL